MPGHLRYRGRRSAHRRPAFDGFIADNAFDNSIIADLNRTRRQKLSFHSVHGVPRLRSTLRSTSGATSIENFSSKLKEFKRIAMHADETVHSFAANIYLAAAVKNVR